MHCPLVAKTNARWSIVDCRLVACAKAADFDERAKSNQSGHRNLNRAPEGEHFIKKSKRDRQAKTGEDSPLGGAWIQRLHYIPTNNQIFSFLVKSNLVKLETSCTVRLPLMVSVLWLKHSKHSMTRLSIPENEKLVTDFSCRGTMPINFLPTRQYEQIVIFFKDHGYNISYENSLNICRLFGLWW